VPLRAASPDHVPPGSGRFFHEEKENSAHLCMYYVQVGVPCSSLFQTVTVRCGHCSNLLYVNLRALLLPPAAAANQLPPFGGQALLSPTSPHGLLVRIACCLSLLPYSIYLADVSCFMPVSFFAVLLMHMPWTICMCRMLRRCRSKHRACSRVLNRRAPA
jgi:hypothetical protein